MSTESAPIRRRRSLPSRLEARDGYVRHTCERQPDPRSHAALHGEAVTLVAHEDGRWWARNSEYRSEIEHCPFCGWELPERVPNPDQLNLELVE